VTDPLIRPAGEWPLILCGPMLRRVTPRSVTVFVALSGARQVRLNVYDSPSAPLPGTAIGTAVEDTTPLGKRLHVAAVTVVFDSAPLQLGHIYGYDLAFFDDTASLLSDDYQRNLSDLALLIGAFPLGYVADQLPSFALPKDLETAHLVHGSCRKPHGHGVDRLADIDEILQASHSDADARPHYLCLTGDQIYADDVCLSVASVIKALQPELLGWPQPETISSLDFDDVQMRPGIPRGTTVLREAKLTTHQADGHVVFLGEYYAMYLLVWSPALWPHIDGGPAAPDVVSTVESEVALPEHSILAFLHYVEEARVRRERGGSDAHITYEKDADKRREDAQTFVDTLPRVRRLLANIPTLMIFDDHDVTDDWNLNRGWVDSVVGTDMGRTLIRNALVAYSVFQDWGNRPEYYEPGAAGRELIEAARFTPAVVDDQGVVTTPAQSPPLGPETFDLTNVAQPTPANPSMAPRLDWHWTVDLAPLPLRIRAVDSRTRRLFPSGADEAAGLLAGADLLTQLGVPPTAAPQPVEIVLAAGPILGVPFWEEFLQRLLVKRDGVAVADNEPWSGHRASFEALLAQLARFGSVVILSGDVHFAHTCNAAWFGSNPGPNEVRGRIVQLCSSGLKNEDLAHKALGWLGHEPTPFQQEMQIPWIGLPPLSTANVTDLRARFDADVEAIGASVPRSPFPITAQPVGTTAANAEEEAWRLWLTTAIVDRLNPPVVLPLDFWPGDSSQQLIDQLASQAEWAYRITYARDPRPEREIEGEIDIREIVGVNNVGHMSFEVGSSGNPTHVVHRIHDRGLAEGAAAYAEHRVVLTPPLPAERPAP